MLQYSNISDGYNLPKTALATAAVAVKNIYIFINVHLASRTCKKILHWSHVAI